MTILRRLLWWLFETPEKHAYLKLKARYGSQDLRTRRAKEDWKHMLGESWDPLI